MLPISYFCLIYSLLKKIPDLEKKVPMCTKLCEIEASYPRHAIPCHARIASRSGSPFPGLPHPSARAEMALVLHLVAAPHEPLDTNCDLSLPGGVSNDTLIPTAVA
eukprot:SAG31_NODE_2384_length_5820_cov_7.105732_1_plen_106_part_00